MNLQHLVLACVCTLQYMYTREKGEIFCDYGQINEEVIYFFFVRYTCFEEEWHSTSQVPISSIKSEEVNRMGKEKPPRERKEKIKSPVILKNSVCLCATELKQVEGQSRSLQRHIYRGADCYRIVLQKTQIIPYEQSCTYAFPLHQFRQQHKTHLSSNKQITASPLMMLAQ